MREWVVGALFGIGAAVTLVGIVMGLSALMIAGDNHRFPESKYRQVSKDCVEQTKWTDVEHGFMWFQTRKEDVRKQIFCKPLITIDPRPIGPFIK